MVDMPAPQKYMFDRSFDVGAAAPVRRGPVTLKPEQVDALKKEAYDMGFSAGQQAGIDEHGQYLKTTLTHIDNSLSTLIQNLSALESEQDQQLRQTILAIARKLMPNFMERYGVDEIKTMLESVIAEMVREPRLVVRIHEADFDTINTTITEITIRKAYAGKVVVLADPAIARGDCRVEWADGGIERNSETTWKAINETVAPDGVTQGTPT